jgi:hypothetical protein
MTPNLETPPMADELKASIEEVWRVADIIKDAEVSTQNGPRNVGYYIRVGIDAFGHPIDREQALLNAAAEAVIANLKEKAEQVISAWAFAHDIDGAARNDLFKRLAALKEE